MPVDRSFVGRVYPPTDPYRVSREKIGEFADSIGDPNPAYRDVDAARALGHPDVIAPPTFPIVLTLKAGHAVIMDPDLGIDYSRVVHGEQRFVHTRPVRAGDVLQVVVTVEEIRAAAGNDLISTRADVSTVEGEAVVSRDVDDRGQGERLMTSGVQVGDVLPAQEFTITRADLVRYAGASGDFNPIHWNERFAKSVGLPDVIAHGMFTMAAAVRVVTDWAGDPGAVVEYGVRFTRPVVVPDPDGATLTVAGSVRAIRDDGLIEIDLTATVNDQTVLAKARAVVRARADG